MAKSKKVSTPLKEEPSKTAMAPDGEAMLDSKKTPSKKKAAPKAKESGKTVISEGAKKKPATAKSAVAKDDSKAVKKAEAEVEPKAEKKAEAKVEPKAEKRAEAKVEPKAEKRAEAKVEAKAEKKAEAVDEATEKDAEPKTTVKKKTKKAPGDLFVSVPDADEISSLAPIDEKEIDESELEKIEMAAIAALPHTEVEPELLLYETDELEDTHETPEEAASYEEFLSDYKDAMAKMLAMAKDAGGSRSKEESELGDISDFIIDEGDFEDLDEDEEDEEYLTDEEIEAMGTEELQLDPDSLPLDNIPFDALEAKDAEADEADTAEAVDERSDSAVSEAEAVVEDAVTEADRAETVAVEADGADAVEAGDVVSEAEAVVEDAAEKAGGADEVKAEKADGADTAEADDAFSEAEAVSEDTAEKAGGSDEVKAEKADEADTVEADGTDTAEAVNDRSDSTVSEAEAVVEDAVTEADEVEAEKADEADTAEAGEADTAEASDGELINETLDIRVTPKVSGSDNFPDISLREYMPEAQVAPVGKASEEASEEDIVEIDSRGVEPYDDEPIQLEMDFGEAAEASDTEEEEEVETPSYDPKKPRFIDTVFDTLELFVFTFAIVMLITTFFVRHSVVDGESMQGTLTDQDIVIISDFLYTPKRGDIVVLEDKAVHPVPLIKRVIAVEGDVVEIKADRTVTVNGEVLVEDYVYMDYGWRVKPGVWKIGEGEIFVLGDHRNESHDSEDFGCVKADSVLGRVLFRLYPFADFGGVD